MAAGSLWQIASPPHLPVFVSSHREDGTRKFSSKWQVGRPWLKDDENGTTCEWCMENKQTLISQSVLTSIKFIDGCTVYKAESKTVQLISLLASAKRQNKIQKKPSHIWRGNSC